MSLHSNLSYFWIPLSVLYLLYTICQTEPSAQPLGIWLMSLMRPPIPSEKGLHLIHPW